MSNLVRLRGVAGSRIDDAGHRETAELLGSGEDYSAAYRDVERQVPQGWLLLHIGRQEDAHPS